MGGADQGIRRERLLKISSWQDPVFLAVSANATVLSVLSGHLFSLLESVTTGERPSQWKSALVRISDRNQTSRHFRFVPESRHSVITSLARASH
jgi:hypothetical protein